MEAGGNFTPMRLGSITEAIWSRLCPDKGAWANPKTRYNLLYRTKGGCWVGRQSDST
ncbi:hypothetical protein SAMN05421507_108182 [Lentzea jiangxiensis]|uniref:Uncharacterized protein n=1 Tax=Lentzea jiangxiensis TaxID=641025 RepID=A0A1H0SQI2_9PSEU|nr:hypothetical protein SAMN05421507_108182 [Lentzea jiangxiensis]